MSYRITPRADPDLDEIWTFIARDDPRAADRVEQDLHDAMEHLSRMPGMGHQRPDAAPRYRFWTARRYPIAYVVERSTIRIVPVLHGARDIGRFLG